ncbi:hypothetical protein [Sphingomonas sp. NFX23]|uniref:hypothetical protein n=1 Tax=Sphingomonas sp. NFX23 TaxID=2819532 RepID=UPI003CF3D419
MTDEPKMPATVAAFLDSPAVRTAVEALLAMEAGALPPGLEWDELDTYYLARGGAELTRHDMAHFLRLLWRTIWGRRLGPHWRPAPLEELVDEEYAVTPEVIWAEKSFTTYHYQEPYVLYTDVRLGPSALSIAFSIEDDDADETLIERHFPPFRWSAPGSREWSGWLVLQVPCEPRGTLPPLAILVEAAAAAYAAAEEAVAAHRLR